MLLRSKKVFLSIFLILIPLFSQQEMQDGINYYGNKEWQKAIEYFRKVLKQNPNKMVAYHYLGASYLEAGKSDEAYDILKEAASKFPNEKTIVGNFINAGILSGKTDEPISAGLKFLRKFPSDPAISALLASAYSKRSDRLFNAGKYGASLADAQTALRYKSSDDNAYSLIIRNYLVTGKIKEAVAEGERAANRFASSLPVQTAYLSALNANQEFEKALLLALKLNKYFSDDIDFQMQLGFLYRANYKIQEGSAVFERLINANPRKEKVYDGAVTYFESLNQYDKVRTIYLAKIKAFGREKEFQIKIAESYENEKLPQQAREVYLTYLKIHDENDLRMLLASSYLESGITDSAVMHLKYILDKDSSDYNALRTLCGIYLEKKLNNELLNSASYYHSLYPEDFHANYYFARAYLNAGKLAESRSFAEKSQRKNTASPLPYTILSEISIISSDKFGAKFYLKQSLLKSFSQIKEMESAINKMMSEINATNSPGLKKRAASAKKELEQLKGIVGNAFTDLRKISQSDEYRGILASLGQTFPKNSFVLSEKGNFHRGASEFDSSKYYYESALEVNPALHECHTGLADIFARQGNLPEAIKSLRRASAAEPDNEKIYDKLIEYSLKSGTASSLADDWIRIYKTDRTNKVLRERLIELLHKTNRFEDANKIVRDIHE